jgi:hypothetical protein
VEKAALLTPVTMAPKPYPWRVIHLNGGAVFIPGMITYMLCTIPLSPLTSLFIFNLESCKPEEYSIPPRVVTISFITDYCGNIFHLDGP